MKISKEQIINALKEKLASYKIPKYFKVVDEIPKNSVGKIVVSKIIEAYGNSDDD